ncbi:MAG: DUF2062 domain-containing protein [Nitrospinaceae bacterium]|nr:DUF2062 domain-containing protein [Nitrospinaceae bacterium]NIR54171.1 DUF2062 domain-containing protein [Nitrospinaceae bacterium]NIS84589.1 DUF2062 domain-containing protein [Nitrospinaceae bacterium]NIT81381.1 DUF2062 domain-containing protein [Nitrospinaceae bacterium]NIU43668.1 DUF2062 domain-containing protein [Nitrospinaceae bacterium]
MESLKRACKYFYYRFIRLQASPESLARGVALGLFISTTPTFGFQTFIALFFAALLRCSKLCAVVAAQLTNALTAPFIFLGTYYLGAVILDSPFDRSKLENLSWEGLRELGPSVFASLWVGGLIVGALLAIIGYFVVIGIDTKAHLQIVRAKRQVERLRRKNAPVYEKID